MQIYVGIFMSPMPNPSIHPPNTLSIRLVCLINKPYHCSAAIQFTSQVQHKTLYPANSIKHKEKKNIEMLASVFGILNLSINLKMHFYDCVM